MVNMRVVALEEHMTTRSVLEASSENPGPPGVAERLLELGDARLQAMDAEGVDVQVLSLTSPGAQEFAAIEAIPLAAEANDVLAAAVSARPDRFEAFASLPTASPAAAVEELHRAVESLGLRGALLNGRTGSRSLDHPEFSDLYEAAEKLGVPLYIHPQLPLESVRAAYYAGWDDELSWLFAGPGIGWHYECGIELLRLILSGTLDRHPGLQVILGHWGEVVLFYLERLAVLDRSSNLDRPIADYMSENVYYTPSGMFSGRYLQWTREIVGVERIMFATDFPYLFPGDGAARRFLEEADLSAGQKGAIASGNWEALTKPR
jgi:uncharacterized protein